ncbi:MAG: hypothetical protein KC994_18125, partial [Candidatus Omnitrophica bacterium]|nr:hypothetical protein [Candidatus Omnitrophota bacterium]
VSLFLFVLFAILHRKTIARELSEIFTTSLIPRLLLLTTVIVVPLVFYVNTKEHYWVPKVSVLTVLTVFGLASWCAVASRIPRRRVPYAWPVSLILLASVTSLFWAVNVAQGIPELALYFSLAGCLFLIVQVCATAKRMHLLLVSIVLVGAVVSVYGLAQSYMLIPSDYLYAQTIRSPVSTMGQMRYAGWFLNLAIPASIFFVLKSPRGGFLWIGLLGYMLLRWHLMSRAQLELTAPFAAAFGFTILVAIFRRRDLLPRLLLLALTEPLLWSMMNLLHVEYFNDVGGWGAHLGDLGSEKVVREYLEENLPSDFTQAATLLASTAGSVNEVFLRSGLRLPSLLGSFLIGILSFLAISRRRSPGMAVWGLTFLLALLPLVAVRQSFPRDLTSVEHFKRSIANVDGQLGPNNDVLIELLNRWSDQFPELLEPYNRFLLNKHLEVALFASFTLFTLLNLHLLFGWIQAGRRRLCLLSCFGFLAWIPLAAVLSGIGRKLGFGLLTPIDNLWGYRWSGSLPDLLLRTDQVPAVLGLVLFSVLGIAWTCWFSRGWKNSRGDRSLWLPRLGSAGVTVAAILCFLPIISIPIEDSKKTSQSEVYLSAFRKIHQSPFSGVGVGNYQIVHPLFESHLESRLLGKEALSRHAYNDFLHFATESGFFNLLGWLWLFAAGLWLTGRTLNNSPDQSEFESTLGITCLMALTVCLIQAQFGKSLATPSSALLAFVWLGVAANLHWLHAHQRVREYNFSQSQSEWEAKDINDLRGTE